MKKYLFIPIFILLLIFSDNSLFSQNVRHTPYPIIFVHGVVGDNTTWSDPDEYDIIDFLTDPSGNTPLSYGGSVNVTLDFDRSVTTLNNTIEEDVHLFTNSPVSSDLYVINFDVHATGSIPIGGAIGHVFMSTPILPGDEHIFVTTPANQFQVSDIIRVRDEFMLVTGVDNSGLILTVQRGLYNSEVVLHLFPDIIYNLSNESNQAAIAKQGYGLKLAIDMIKNRTGSNKVILVCHSMGGLAAREYIRTYYNNDIAKIVTIGTPPLWL
ncbi:MAG: esterase/lipase family protein [Bacteroidales bacterium]